MRRATAGFPELLRRRVIPSAVIRLSQVDHAARISARLRRAAGGRGRVELFFAFDDPCSAVALSDLERRLAGRAVDLVTLPVVRRGIAGDPAVEAKRRYAIVDARRLARRSGLALARVEPLAPDATAFLAEWVAAAAPRPAITAFCAAALRQLWLTSPGPVQEAPLRALWQELTGSDPVAEAAAVRRNERLMTRRGPYDVPAAVVHGQWFFAHDRLAQIASRLDDLGWTA